MDTNTRSLLSYGSWWGKAVVAGLIGGVAMAAYLMIAASIMGLGFWTPVYMIAGVFQAYRPPVPGTAGAAAAGVFLHLLTAAFWGAAFAWLAGIFPRTVHGWGASTLWGLAYGIVVWVIMGEGIGPSLSPPMDQAPAVNFFISHLIFGMVTAWVLYAWANGRELANAGISTRAGNRPLGVRPT
jgi:hypothetical protein